MGLSVVLREYFWLALFAVVATGAGIWSWARKDTRRASLDQYLLRLPLIGDVATKFAISQLARTLATLLSGGVPLVESLNVAARSVANRHLSRQLRGIVQEVSEGQSLAVSMGARTTFPSVAVKMVEVGESTGALKDMLNSVADFFDEEIETTLERFMAVIEPVLLIVMGIVIAGLLLSLYWPLLQLGAIVS